MARKKEKVKIVCKKCGIDFFVNEYRMKNNPSFCSRSCMDKFNAARMLSFICEECNVSFSIEERFIRDGKHSGRFCSLDCAYKNRIINGIALCAFCHEEFKKSNKDSKYCSNQCKFDDHKGEGSYWWKGGITPQNVRDRNDPLYRQWRKEVFIRDDFTCQDCGQKGGKLEAHHVQLWSTHLDIRFDINNGQTLCVKCHKKKPRKV